MSQEQVDALTALIYDWGGKILFALVIFFVGKWIANLLKGLIKRALVKGKIDDVLVGFLSNIAYYLLMIAVVIAAIQKLGIQTTSLIAVLGAAGLAVGLALQGSLSNFASGVLIILFRPFKIGDYVEAGGVAGVVDEIGILVTQMHSPDNKGIIVPNSQVMSGTIVNYNAHDIRRVDMVFGIGYADDIDKARAAIADVLAKDSRVLKEPAPMIAVGALGDSSVNFNVRPWCQAADYWNVYLDTHEAIKKRFDADGISIPFPQRDVHVFKHEA